MKLIRWGGIAAFIIVVGGIVGFWYFFADDLLKHSIETSASDAMEAEVSIDTLDISLQPLGIELKHMQFANAQSPMQNAVEFDRAVAHLHFLKLLQGQVIIESLAVEGLRFNTQRTRPGIWKKKAVEPEPESTGDSLFEFPDLQVQLPETDDILARQDLVTTRMSQQLQLHYDEESKKLELAFQRIPDADKFRDYETRIKAATSGKVTSIDDFKQRKAALDKVHDELRADQQALKDAKNQLNSSKDLLSADIKALKAAPGQDMENIKNQYRLDESGAANISRLLFGEQAGQWTRTGLYYYNRLKPVLATDPEEKERKQRAEGRYVHFHSDHPTPDFLLRDAHIDVLIPFGHLDARLQDVTHQMNITGKPATLTVRGKQLHDMKSFAIDGVFNHIKPGQGRDSLQFKVDDIRIQSVALVKNEKLPITLTQANLDINGKLVYEKQFSGDVNAEFNPVSFSSQGSSTLGSMFAQAFTGIQRFNVMADVRGTFSDLDMDIKSDIDEQIKNSLKQQWDARVAAFREKIRARLDAEEQKVRNRFEGELARLEQKKAELENKLKQSEEMLKAKVADYADEQKQKLDEKKDQKLDKLKEDLKKKLKL